MNFIEFKKNIFIPSSFSHLIEVTVCVTQLTVRHRNEITVCVIQLTVRHRNEITVCVIQLTGRHRNEITVCVIQLTGRHPNKMMVFVTQLAAHREPQESIAIRGGKNSILDGRRNGISILPECLPAQRQLITAAGTWKELMCPTDLRKQGSFIRFNVSR